MIRPHIARLVQQCLSRLVADGQIPPADYGPIEIADTKNPDHGDYSCNVALTKSKTAGMPPRAFAELLTRELAQHSDVLSIEIAGPGFLNFRMSSSFLAAYVNEILKRGSEHAQSQVQQPLKINVEFVSVNPNGPITVGSGRGAAFGDTLSRVLQASGHEVTREFYINDGVNSEQMRLFAESVLHYYRELVGIPSEMPENGYKGDYVARIARKIFEQERNTRKHEPLDWFRIESQNLMIDRHREDLAAFGVHFDIWFSEQSLHDRNEVQ